MTPIYFKSHIEGPFRRGYLHGFVQDVETSDALAIVSSCTGRFYQLPLEYISTKKTRKKKFRNTPIVSK